MHYEYGFVASLIRADLEYFTKHFVCEQIKRMKVERKVGKFLQCTFCTCNENASIKFVRFLQQRNAANE